MNFNLAIVGFGVIGLEVVSKIFKSKVKKKIKILILEKDIKNMLILECSILCLIAGSIGIFFGVIITTVIAKLASWSLQIQPQSVIDSLGFSLMVGVISALSPAKRIQKIPVAYVLKGE